MRQYKIFTTANKLNIIDQKTNIIYSALLTEALVRQLKDGEDGFKIYNVRDWNENKILTLKEILKEDGSKYASVEDFIGNFNGGGSAPKTKQGAYRIYHDGDAYQIIKVGNGLGHDLTLTKTGVGTYEVTGFTDNLSGGRGYVFCDKSIPEYLDGTVLKKVCDLSFNTEDGVLTLTILDITTQLPTDELLTSFDLLFTVIL